MAGNQVQFKTEAELRAIQPPLPESIIRHILDVQAMVRRRREQQLRQALPSALTLALCDSRSYHRSILTGRCGSAL